MILAGSGVAPADHNFRPHWFASECWWGRWFRLVEPDQDARLEQGEARTVETMRYYRARRLRGGDDGLEPRAAAC